MLDGSTLALHAWMLSHVFAEASLTFAWTVVCSGIVYLVPLQLPVGFALALPPATGVLWVRGRMPLLAVQLAQALSGTRSAHSLRDSALGHTVGAFCAVVALKNLEALAGVQGLVPNPQLGTSTSPLMGMLVEASALAYLVLVVAVVPNWLLSHGLPKGLVLCLIGPMMAGTKGITGPSLQPVITLILKLLEEGSGGTAAVAEALLPYGAGPLLGAAAVGIAMRGRQLPFQEVPGLPVQLIAIEPKARQTEKQGNKDS